MWTSSQQEDRQKFLDFSNGGLAYIRATLLLITMTNFGEMF